MLLITIAYAILALTFVVGKSAVALAHPFFLIGIRMIIGGMILLTFDIIRHSYHSKLKERFFQALWREKARLLKITFFHIYLAFSCEFWALQYVTSAKTNLIFATTPFIAAALSYFILHQKLSLKKWLAMIIGICAILPVTMPPDTFTWNVSTIEATATSRSYFAFDHWIPEVVLFIGVTSASYAWFDIKKLLSQGVSLVLINGISMFLGGIASIVTTWVCLGDQGFRSTDPSALIGHVMLMVLISNILFYNIYGYLMHRYSITFLTFAGFLCPLFGTFYGYYLLDEVISWHYGVALAIVTVALALFYSEEKRVQTDASPSNHSTS